MNRMDTNAIVITHRSSFEFFDLYSNDLEIHQDWSPAGSRETLDNFGQDDRTVERLRTLKLPQPVEILVPDAGGKHRTDDLVFRERKSPLLLEDLVQVSDGTYVCVPELALSMIAGHVSCPRAAMLIDQELGTYRMLRKSSISLYEASNPLNHMHALTTGSGSTRLEATMYGLEHQTTLAQLERYVSARKGCFGIKRLREALPLCSEGLRSPLEAQDYLLLFAPRRLGGFGLAKPVVNKEVRLSAKAREIINAETLKPDFHWPGKRVVVEVLGKSDHEGSGARIADTSQRERVWRVMGYTSITHTSTEINDSQQLATCARELARHLGQRYRTDIDNFDVRRAWLRQEVLGRIGETAKSMRSYKELLADTELEWIAERY